MLAPEYHPCVALHPRERRLLDIVAILAAIWLGLQVAAWAWLAIARVADVVLIFLSAWALAYLVGPLVDRIERRSRLGRAGAVGVVYAVLFLVLGGVVALVLPGLADQLAALAKNGPEYGDKAAKAVADFQRGLSGSGVPFDLTSAYGALPARLGDLASGYAADALGFVSTAAGVVFDIVLVLIIAFLMLLDGDALWARFTNALSEELRSEAELFRASAEEAFGGFIRGSLLVGIIYGVVTFAILAPFGVPFSGVLSTVAGLAVLIPFFGPIIALVPIAAIALLGAPDRFLAVMLITVAVQQVMFNVVSPRILSRSVGVHPLFVFAALLLGSRLAGFWGVFLAIPFAGIAATFLRYGYELAKGRRARSEAAALIGDRDAAG